MEPVKSNTRNKTCNSPISSSDIIYPGYFQGLCPNPDLTDVICALIQTVNSSSACCTNVYPYPLPTGAVIGSWVDFSALIPASGSGSGYAYTIANMGIGEFGYPECNSSYRFTTQGEIQFKGGFAIELTPAVAAGDFVINLVTPASVNFPLAWGNSFTKLLDVFIENVKGLTVVSTYLYLNYPTGQIQLQGNYIGAIPGLVYSIPVPLSGSQFNIA